MFLPSLGGAVRKFAYAQESVDLARVAIALERYRLAHGAYPESLDALSPQFIAKLPHDVINGQPLHYRRTSDGQFILYSVGWNEKDDGGEVAFKQDGSVDISTGDWVWRYPSKN
jgi:type II secretory pathway pseudopilin PulG